MQTYQGNQPAFSEAHFAMVFAANDSTPQRIDSRVWPDGVRTDGKTDRIDSGLPLMKSVVVR